MSDSRMGQLVPCLALALAFLLSGTARADVVTGQVVNAQGAGLAGVTLGFNGGITPVNAVTAANGTFSTTVPAGIYDIVFLPPVGATVAPGLRAGVPVLGTVNIGVVTLVAGVALSGVVTTSTGAPVVAGDIDVFDAATGGKLYTPNDATTTTGSFSVLVPPGTYDVRLEPPTGALLVARVVAAVSVSGPTSIGTQTLAPGFLLSGTVRNVTTLVPVADVDIDVDDAVTGQRIPTPNDDTAANGTFGVVVPAGTFRVSFEPPPGVPLVGRRIDGVVVAGGTSLGFVALQPGLTLTGTVTGPAGGIPGADLDVTSVVGDVPVFTSNDTTSVTGAFSLVVPAGHYVVTALPPAGSGLAAGRTNALSVSANTSVGTIGLQTGVTLSGTVTAFASLAPQARVKIVVTNTATGAVVGTPGAMTSTAGFYSTVVPVGTYDVAFRTSRGSLAADGVATSVAVSGATTLNRQLGIVSMFVFMAPSLPVEPAILAPGNSLFVTLALFNPSFGSETANLTVSVLAANGTEFPLAPAFPYTLGGGQFGFAVFLPLQLPPIQPGDLGLPLAYRITLRHPATNAVIDRDEVLFIVQ